MSERVITEAVRFAEKVDPERKSQEWSIRADEDWDYYNDDDEGE